MSESSESASPSPPPRRRSKRKTEKKTKPRKSPAQRAPPQRSNNELYENLLDGIRSQRGMGSSYTQPVASAPRSSGFGSIFG